MQVLSSFRCFLACSALLILSPVSIEARNDTWYSRYPAYPPYCSTPEEMATRAIPPLADSKIRGDSRLVHATAIIRHGARTPYSSNLDCWDGYWDQGGWDCDLTTFLSPPSPWAVEEEEGWRPGGSDAMFLFEKKYDALQPPLYNELGGTCQQGQLILQGYEQEIANGEHLRNAYVFSGDNYDHDIRLRLLDLSDSDNLVYQEPILKYRSDDDQRTLMSGQVLLRGLFGTEFVQHLKNTGVHPIIPLHTADKPKDVMAPSAITCPRLGDLQNKAERSWAFRSLTHSREAKQINKFKKKKLGGEVKDVMECSMTTICTDRELPDVINDYHGPPDHDHHHGDRKLHNGEDDEDEDEDDDDHERSWFTHLVNYDIQLYSFHLRYNNAECAKLAMGPLWAEILDNLPPAVTGRVPAAKDTDRPRPDNKLALFSGHDTTIMPLLATLGERVWDGHSWTPYASMLLIEIHELIDGQSDRSIYKSDYAFRLLLNGKVLTDKLDGCPAGEDLCDVTILLDRVAPFASRDRDCTSRFSFDAIKTTDNLLKTPGGFFLMLSVVLVSAVLGALATFYYLTKTCPWSKRSTLMGTYDLQLSEDDDVNGNSSGGYRDDPEEEDFASRITVI